MKFQWFDSVGVLTKVGAGKICEVCQVSHYVIISQSSEDGVTVIIDYREALSIFAMLPAGLGLESGDWVGLGWIMESLVKLVTGYSSLQPTNLTTTTTHMPYRNGITQWTFPPLPQAN